MTGKQALFRLSQRLPRNMRERAINTARSKLKRTSINPMDTKLMGFVSETMSLSVINRCLYCQNPYLHYCFLDYLLGKHEKSWKDIECKKCNQFIVEVKSTRFKNPRKLHGGCYKSFERMTVKPYLLVFGNLHYDDEGKYRYDTPELYPSSNYAVVPRNNGKSYIILNPHLINMKNNENSKK